MSQNHYNHNLFFLMTKALIFRLRNVRMKRLRLTAMNLSQMKTESLIDPFQSSLRDRKSFFLFLWSRETLGVVKDFDCIVNTGCSLLQFHFFLRCRFLYIWEYITTPAILQIRKIICHKAMRSDVTSTTLLRTSGRETLV